MMYGRLITSPKRQRRVTISLHRPFKPIYVASRATFQGVDIHHAFNLLHRIVSLPDYSYNADMWIWHYFYKNGTPRYLARYYWWAYIWKWGVWFFDHQPIINGILFGFYKALMNRALELIRCSDNGAHCEQLPQRFLQIACVYGELSSQITQSIGTQQFHIMDVATIQLKTTRNKLNTVRAHNRASTAPYYLAKMNAEQLAYCDNSFDTVLLFFLLHELPAKERLQCLVEATRVLHPNGHIIIVEYGELSARHWLQRFPLTRLILTHLEPFLGDFWQSNLHTTLNSCALSQGKTVTQYQQTDFFGGFYRVVHSRIQEKQE